MRVLAMHDDNQVVIVAMAYEEGTNLKAIYFNEDGEIDADDVANFVVIENQARITPTG